MEYLAVAMLLLALTYTFQSTSAIRGSSSSYGIGMNTDGAFQLPVFHNYHPYVRSLTQAANVPNSTIIGDNGIRKNQFFTRISIGTPAVFNLVTIDTGSTLPWVQCQNCEIYCHNHSEKAGPVFNPYSSSTYRGIGCSTQVCLDMHESLHITSGCFEEEDTCLYSVRYASKEYSVGYLGQDRLTFANSFSVDKFIFGCGADSRYNGGNAGILGFANKSYSFFNQIAEQTNYIAFSYCFPSNQENEGFLSVGPYAPDSKLIWTQLIGYGYLPVYAVQQFGMMVNGMQLEIDPFIYTMGMTIVDSGSADSYIFSPVFDALDKAVTTAMEAKGYARASNAEKKICFTSTSDSTNWSDLPTVEVKFSRSVLKLPGKNVFYQETDGTICSTFRPDDAGVRGVQIIGNNAMRSFRVVFDIQGRKFGFEANAC